MRRLNLMSDRLTVDLINIENFQVDVHLSLIIE